MELVRMLECVPGLMPHDAHAFGARGAFDVQKLVVLEPAKPRVSEVEWTSEAGNVRRREPVIRKPDVRFEPEQPLFELRVEAVDALLQPGPLDGEVEVPDSHPQEAVVGVAGPAHVAVGSRKGEAEQMA